MRKAECCVLKAASALKRDAGIVDAVIAEKKGCSYEEALDLFYNSITFELISEGVADMHCMSDEYLTDELLLEYCTR